MATKGEITKSKKKPTPDTLAKTTKKSDIELKEEDLRRVTGGLIQKASGGDADGG